MKPHTTLAAACGIVAIAGTVFLATRAGAADKADPLTSFHVGIKTDVDLGYALEANFIGSETEVVETKTLADPAHAQKIPGRLQFSNAVIKRGYTNDLSWYRWRKQVEDGQVAAARKDTTITVFDSQGRTVTTMKLLRAWPSAVKMNGAGIEEMTLTCEGWSRQ